MAFNPLLELVDLNKELLELLKANQEEIVKDSVLTELANSHGLFVRDIDDLGRSFELLDDDNSKRELAIKLRVNANMALYSGKYLMSELKSMFQKN